MRYFVCLMVILPGCASQSSVTTNNAADQAAEPTDTVVYNSAAGWRVFFLINDIPTMYVNGGTAVKGHAISGIFSLEPGLEQRDSNILTVYATPLVAQPPDLTLQIARNLDAPGANFAIKAGEPNKEIVKEIKLDGLPNGAWRFAGAASLDVSATTRETAGLTDRDAVFDQYKLQVDAIEKHDVATIVRMRQPAEELLSGDGKEWANQATSQMKAIFATNPTVEAVPIEKIEYRVFDKGVVLFPPQDAPDGEMLQTHSN